MQYLLFFYCSLFFVRCILPHMGLAIFERFFVIIEVKVVPAAGKHGWVIDKGGHIKCYLKSPAERGLANHELLKIIAQALKIPQMKVRLIRGETSRKKLIEIDKDIRPADFLKAVGIEPQMSVFKSND